LEELVRRLHHEWIANNRLYSRQYSRGPGTTHFCIRISNFRISMSVRAVFTKFALSFLNKKFAPLCFVVIIRDVHHFHLHFYRQWLFSFPQFMFTMCKMAPISNRAVMSLLKMLA
jgi:hypothetical protein